MSMVELEKRDRVWWILLNRPEKKNAFNGEMVSGLVRALSEAEAAPEARVVVIASREGVFGAGAELDWIQSYPQSRLRLMHAAHQVSNLVLRLPQPTVSVVRGFAAGGACSIALNCDFVLMESEAKLVFPFGRVGLSVDSGASLAMARLLGYRKAIEWALLGGEITAAEALASGLVTGVHAAGEIEAAADSLALRLADLPPDATLLTKYLVRTAFGDASGSSAIQRETVAQAYNMLAGEHAEGIAAMRDRRRPGF
jgi:enoyl-CoA hydratase/carnithine racemase